MTSDVCSEQMFEQFYHTMSTVRILAMRRTISMFCSSDPKGLYVKMALVPLMIEINVYLPNFSNRLIGIINFILKTLDFSKTISATQ